MKWFSDHLLKKASFQSEQKMRGPLSVDEDPVLELDEVRVHGQSVLHAPHGEKVQHKGALG
jgi:hypothetical protein